MTYRNLMVNLALGQSNRSVLAVTQHLAQRFDAGVLGVAGGHPFQVSYPDGYAGDDISEIESKEIARLLVGAKSEFLNAFEGCTQKLDWRSTETFESLGEFSARQAKCADLLITSLASGDFFGMSHAVDVADLIMRAGRPVLVVPPHIEKLELDWVLVAWKDAREARRAVADAIPLLKLARQVRVVEIADKHDLSSASQGLADVVGWLNTHGVSAQSAVESSNQDDPDQLGRLATEQGADLIVAGAYGHSRLREWALGGVTRNLLHGQQRCCFLSH